MLDSASFDDAVQVNAMGHSAVVYTTVKGRQNSVCQQLGNACTVGARAIMHLAAGADVLVRPPTPLIKMFYQDTDSNYNCMNVVRKWRERGLYGDELGQFKNDTVKDGDGVGVLGYFL